MNKKSCLLLLLLLACVCKNIHAQIAYEDAKRLYRMRTAAGDLDAGKDSVWKILANYVPDSMTSRDAVTSLFNTSSSGDPNPFIEIAGTEQQAEDRMPSSFSSLVSAAGGIDVSTIADGLAKFIVQRAKQDLNVMFFSNFKKVIQQHEELRVLFPVTTDFLEVTEPYDYANFINVLREGFQEDLKNLLVNVNKLYELPRYRGLLQRPEFQPVRNTLLMAFSAAGMVSKLSGGAHPADVIADLNTLALADTGMHSNLFSGLKMLAILSQSIREPENGPAAGNGWIPAQELKDSLLGNPALFRLYLGLVYQQVENVTFYTHKSNGQEVAVTFRELLARHGSTAKGISDTLKRYFKTFFGYTQKTEQLIRQIRDASRDSVPADRYYNYFITVADFVDFGLNTYGYFYPAAKGKYEADLKEYMKLVKKGVEIYKDISDKQYGAAIMNTVVLFDQSLASRIDTIVSALQTASALAMEDYTLLKKVSVSHGKLNGFDSTKVYHVSDSLLQQLRAVAADLGIHANEAALEDHYEAVLQTWRSQLLSRVKEYDSTIMNWQVTQDVKTFLLKYGSFMVSVVEADNSDDVAAAIENAALPSGSSSIKQFSSFSVSINAYLGFFGGLSNKTNTSSQNIYSAGITAPIGLAASWGINSNIVGAFTVFVPVIDLGAIASFRLNDDTTQALPQLALVNIVAPGIHLIAGRIANTPLSLGVGYQMAPRLRSISGTNADVISDNEWRWSVSLLWDIPMFNVYAKPKQ